MSGDVGHPPHRRADQAGGSASASRTAVVPSLTALVLVLAATVLVIAGVPLGFLPVTVAIWLLRWADRRAPGGSWPAMTFLGMVPFFIMMIVVLVRR